MNDSPDQLLTKRLLLVEAHYKAYKESFEQLAFCYDNIMDLIKCMSTFMPEKEYYDSLGDFLPLDKQDEFKENARRLNLIKQFLSGEEVNE